MNYEEKRILERRTMDQRDKEIYDKIAEIASLVREMHQRQNERTIPAIEKIEKTLFGNGKPGLAEEHISCKNTIKNLNNFMVGTIVLMSGCMISILGFFGVKLFERLIGK